MLDRLEVLQALLEDEDLYGFIKAGAFPTFYDPWCQSIIDHLSSDISIEQLERLIWDTAYAHTCMCTVHDTGKPWVLEREQAKFILGEPSRFNRLAKDIRFIVMSF